MIRHNTLLRPTLETVTEIKIMIEKVVVKNFRAIKSATLETLPLATRRNNLWLVAWHGLNFLHAIYAQSTIHLSTINR